MAMTVTRWQALGLAASSVLATPAIARAQQAPGVTQTEILLGQTMPYSGPASNYDLLKGFRDGVGGKTNQIMLVQSYEGSDPTIDSQINNLHQAGADTLFATGIPRFTALGLRAVTALNWKPLYVISSTGSSVASAILPVGPEHAVGLISGAYMKDPSDPRWKGDPGYQDWFAFMRKHRPDTELTDINNVYGYCAAQTLIPVLKQCGEDLSRENIMRQATNLDIQLPRFQNGIRFTTAPTDYFGIKKLRLQRFDGKAWVPFGSPIGV